jgi:copper chaperone
MPTAIICLILFLIIIFSVKNFLKRISIGCCGGGDAPCKNSATDKNKKHYPFEARLEISGMSCQSCAIHVENALNSLEGVWAKVSLSKQAAVVLMKSELSDAQLTRPVATAGYLVCEIHRIPGKL